MQRSFSIISAPADKGNIYSTFIFSFFKKVTILFLVSQHCVPMVASADGPAVFNAAYEYPAVTYLACVGGIKDYFNRLIYQVVAKDYLYPHSLYYVCAIDHGKSALGETDQFP